MSQNEIYLYLPYQFLPLLVSFRPCMPGGRRERISSFHYSPSSIFSFHPFFPSTHSIHSFYPLFPSTLSIDSLNRLSQSTLSFRVMTTILSDLNFDYLVNPPFSQNYQGFKLLASWSTSTTHRQE